MLRRILFRMIKDILLCRSILCNNENVHYLWDGRGFFCCILLAGMKVDDFDSILFFCLFWTLSALHSFWKERKKIETAAGFNASHYSISMGQHTYCTITFPWKRQSSSAQCERKQEIFISREFDVIINLTY